MNISFEKVAQKGYDSKFPKNDLLEPFAKTVFTVPCLLVVANGVGNVVPQTGIKDGATESKTELSNKAVVTETVTSNGNVTMFPISSIDGKITRWVSQEFVLDLVKEGKLKNEHFTTREELKTKTTKESAVTGATDVKRLQFQIELERPEGRALAIGALQIPTKTFSEVVVSGTTYKSLEDLKAARKEATINDNEALVAELSEAIANA